MLNIAYSALSVGTCLEEDIELRRNDNVYLDAVGTQPRTRCRRPLLPPVTTRAARSDEVQDRLV